MAEVIVDNATLMVEIKGLHKVWAVKNRLEIPLAHVAGIRHDASIEMPGWLAMKFPATNIPGVFAAGTFRAEGKWVFWDVRDPARAVVIDLRDERYAKLVIEVDNPDEIVALVDRALTTSSVTL